MVDTDFTCPKEKLSRLASLYEHNPSGEPRFMETPALDVTYLSGGGGLFSTMSDYYQFASMLLNQGELNGKRIIGRKTIELIMKNYKTNYLFYFYNEFKKKHIFSKNYKEHSKKLDDYRQKK